MTEQDTKKEVRKDHEKEYVDIIINRQRKEIERQAGLLSDEYLENFIKNN